jgi:hypothetical protein
MLRQLGFPNFDNDPRGTVWAEHMETIRDQWDFLESSPSAIMAGTMVPPFVTSPLTFGALTSSVFILLSLPVKLSHNPLYLAYCGACGDQVSC